LRFIRKRTPFLSFFFFPAPTFEKGRTSPPPPPFSSSCKSPFSWGDEECLSFSCAASFFQVRRQPLQASITPNVSIFSFSFCGQKEFPCPPLSFSCRSYPFLCKEGSDPPPLCNNARNPPQHFSFKKKEKYAALPISAGVVLPLFSLEKAPPPLHQANNAIFSRFAQSA